jgi:hypothetical protein
VASDNNLLHVREVVLVGVPRNELVKNLIRRDGLGLVRVLVGTAASPLRCPPDQQVSPRLVATSCLLLGTRRIIPVRVCDVLVVSVRETRCIDDNGVEVDVRVGGNLRKCTQHLERRSILDP